MARELIGFLSPDADDDAIDAFVAALRGEAPHFQDVPRTGRRRAVGRAETRRRSTERSDPGVPRKGREA